MNIFDYFSKNKKIMDIVNLDNAKLSKSSSGFNKMLIALDFYKNNRTIFVILPTQYEALEYYESLINYVNSDDVLLFPADMMLSTSMLSSSSDFLFMRIETIYNLLLNDKKIVITNFHGVIKYEFNKNKWINSYINLKQKDIINIKELEYRLVNIGYKKVFNVSKTGDYSRKGSIIDIYPLGYDNPIRIDFFDDEIDIIKEFDPNTQRSIDKIDNIIITPVSEFLITDDELKNGIDNINKFLSNYKLSELEKDLYKRDIENLNLRNDLDLLSRYMPFFNDDLMTILDFKENKKVYLIDPVNISAGYKKLEDDVLDLSIRLLSESIKHIDMYEPLDSLLNKSNIIIEGLVDILDKDLDINSKDVISFKANKKLIGSELSDYLVSYKIIVSVINKDRLKNLKELLKELNIPYADIKDYERITNKQINIISESIPDFKFDDIYLISESKLFNVEYKRVKPKFKSLFKNATKISRYDDLELGDYVVHYDYGIGIYEGIKTIELGGIKRDVISIKYGNNSNLSIPLEQINSLMKYASHDAINVTINNIGDSSWQRSKAKVRNRLHDISEKLISLYARRNKSEGFEYPSDTKEQIDFENDFPYELTDGQKKAIEEAKLDMESKKPMDRLICGDVGYGKTEVALRLAFKAIMSGKQVAVLAPTTILCRQHYHTFKERMEKYGAKVCQLSRFVSKKEQTEAIEGLKSGIVDCVIGTHRLLSSDISFKDLGLLIVDEEQRFGVTHKEKIKELKVNIDCITLSATPIPRTLQMSIMGLKDLSVIETPPKNRYPIQTYVIERNDKIIASAIEREVSRGGQVFYLYNYVEDIDVIKNHLQNLCPFAKIGVAHGKMNKDKLEEIICDFIDGKYDILLCTTIVEIGIDMPNTNTLIIHDSDRLGLSQMYQIRGRVGRSNKIAYAYMMYEPRKILTKEAEKRLETIKEFNELGSGYKIAMRDLSIRGSGDILGDSQSGFIETVGLDTYLKILDEEIHVLNKNSLEEKEKENKNTLQTILVNRTISTDYISNDDTRIEIHKKIDKLESINEMNDLLQELEDRFGKPDLELVIYMKEKIMKSIARKLNINKITKLNNNDFRLEFDEENTKLQDGIFIFNNMKKYPHIKPYASNFRLVFDIKCNGYNLNLLFDETINFLNMLYDHNLNRNK